MVMRLDDKKTLFIGLAITLGITVFGGFILTSFMMPECTDVLC